MTQTFKESFYFFRANLGKLLAYTFAIGILVMVVAQVLINLVVEPTASQELVLDETTLDSLQLIAQFINVLIKPVYIGGLIIMIYSLAMEQAKGIGHCLLAGIMRWPAMVVANLITLFLFAAGLALFILPGIWVFSRLFLVPYLVMLKNQSPVDAINNSFQYTKGYSLTILIDVALLIIILTAIVLILNLLQIFNPLFLLILILLFQTMISVVYYRHYELLVESADKNKELSG